MLFRDVVGHKDIKDRLRREADDGRVAHALLFYGPEGCGKLPLALAFARYLLCSHPNEGEPCGACNNCRMTARWTHPDLHFVFPVVKYKDAAHSISDVYLRRNKEQEKKLVFTRKFYTDTWDDAGKVEVDFKEFSSSGTNHLYRLLRNILYVMEFGGVFIADEIHSHLHPLLTRKIIEMFHSAEHNPNNAQLICTAHDALLLNEDIRRDQIWFIEKDIFGKSSLYSLADFKNVRKDDDKLKKYLMGVFGAIPELFDMD